MAKFYTDGKDDMIVYKFSTRFAPVDPDSFDKSVETNRFDKTGETKYVCDESILDKAVADFTRRYYDAKNNAYRSDYRIGFTWTYDNFVTTCTIDDEDGFLAEFKLEEIRIPNDLFDKMPETAKYSFPDNDFVNVSYVPTPHLRGNEITGTPALIKNTAGSQLGTYNTYTSADAIRAVKSPNFVETFNVANFFGNFSRVPVADRDKYNAALTEAEKTYGDYITDFIVPDASKLTKAQCKDIVKEYDEIKKSVETPGDCIPVVFDLETYSTKIISELGTGPTIY
nr:MAG TPA: hypothetical protein [Caudoviricetes sp.]